MNMRGTYYVYEIQMFVLSKDEDRRHAKANIHLFSLLTPYCCAPESKQTYDGIGL